MTPLCEPMDQGRLGALGVLNLAHVGDAVYELLVRQSLARQSATTLREQHKNTIAYVAAPAQAEAMEKLAPFLTEEERRICRRGRNTRVRGVPSGCTVAQYHAATALETLFGWLWLSGREERIRELFTILWENQPDAS